MDQTVPEVVISDSHAAALPKQKGRSFIIPVILLIILTGAAAVFFASLKNVQQNTDTKQVKQVVLTADQKRLAMEKDVKLSFTSSKDKNVISWINLAAKVDDPAKQYQYYVKAFSGMVSSYKYSQNRKPEQKSAMLAVKEYANSLPGYKEVNFVMPN